MKRAIKVAVIVLLVVIALGLLVKHENFLQVHYDTIEERNLERTSLFGLELKESVKWSKGGYRKQYREIFEVEPSEDRWRSWPIRTVWLGTERWRSGDRALLQLRDLPDGVDGDHRRLCRREGSATAPHPARHD